jgi:hypothetical protein
LKIAYGHRKTEAKKNMESINKSREREARKKAMVRFNFTQVTESMCNKTRIGENVKLEKECN